MILNRGYRYQENVLSFHLPFLSFPPVVLGGINVLVGGQATRYSSSRKDWSSWAFICSELQDFKNHLFKDQGMRELDECETVRRHYNALPNGCSWSFYWTDTLRLPGQKFVRSCSGRLCCESGSTSLRTQEICAFVHNIMHHMQK